MTDREIDGLLALEVATRRWVSCTRSQQQREKPGCLHVDEQGKSCFLLTIESVTDLNDIRRMEMEGI